MTDNSTKKTSTKGPDAAIEDEFDEYLNDEESTTSSWWSMFFGGSSTDIPTIKSTTKSASANSNSDDKTNDDKLSNQDLEGQSEKETIDSAEGTRDDKKNDDDKTSTPLESDENLGQAEEASDSIKDSLKINIPSNAHHWFEEDWFDIAKAKQAQHSASNDLSMFAQDLDNLLNRKIIDLTNQTINVQDLSLKGLSDREVSKEDTNEINELQKALKQVYVKKVIDVLHLRPTDFITTPEIFCEVFEVCDYITTIPSRENHSDAAVKTTPMTMTNLSNNNSNMDDKNFNDKTSSNQELDKSVNQSGDSLNDNLTIHIPSSAHPSFEEHWFEIAKAKQAQHSTSNELSTLVQDLDNLLNRKIIELTNQNIHVQDLSLNGLEREVRKEDMNKINELQKALKQVYVKNVIVVLHLRPTDFITTPEVFCKVFEICDYITTNPNQNDSDAAKETTARSDIAMTNSENTNTNMDDNKKSDDVTSSNKESDVSENPSEEASDSLKDSLTFAIPSNAHPWFQEDWFEIAKANQAQHSASNELSTFAEDLDNLLNKKIIEKTNQNVHVQDLSIKGLSDLETTGEVSKENINDITKLQKALKQVYVKRVIIVLHLHPSDFNTTPEMFCQVFEICNLVTMPAQNDLDAASGSNSNEEKAASGGGSSAPSDKDNSSTKPDQETLKSDTGSSASIAADIDNSLLFKTSTTTTTSSTTSTTRTTTQQTTTTTKSTTTEFSFINTILSVLGIRSVQGAMRRFMSNKEAMELANPDPMFKDEWYDFVLENILTNGFNETMFQKKTMLRYLWRLDQFTENQLHPLNNDYTFIHNLDLAPIMEMDKAGKVSKDDMKLVVSMQKVLKKAFVKKVIVTLDLGPRVFNTTPEVFCKVFEICKYVTADTEPYAKGVDDLEGEIQSLNPSQFKQNWYDTVKTKEADLLVSDDDKAILQSYSKHLEDYLKDKAKEWTNQDLAINDLSVKDLDTLRASGQISDDDIKKIKDLQKTLKQMYIKKVLITLDLGPSDLDSTPDEFCEVFEICDYIPVTTAGMSHDTTLSVIDEAESAAAAGSNQVQVEIQIPSEVNELFEREWYEKAREIFLDKMKDGLQTKNEVNISMFSKAIDIYLQSQIKGLTGIDLAIKNLNIDQFLAIAKRKGIDQSVIDEITKLKDILEQQLVQQVIKEFGLHPREFGTTPEVYCQVFNICEFSTNDEGEGVDHFSLEISTEVVKDVTNNVIRVTEENSAKAAEEVVENDHLKTDTNQSGSEDKESGSVDKGNNDQVDNFIDPFFDNDLVNGNAVVQTESFTEDPLDVLVNSESKI